MDNSPQRILYRVERAADLCDMGRSKFWDLVMSGEIRSLKIGRARRIPADALQEFIDRKLAETKNDESSKLVDRCR